MKTCKRLVTLLLALCFALSCVAYASTEITQESSAQTANTTVVLDLGVEPTRYTIVIPSTVTLDKDDGTGSATITLKSGFVLTEVTSLKVRATGGYSEYRFTQGTGGGASTSYYAYITLQNTDNDSTLKCWLTPNDLKYTDNLISVTNQSDNSKDYSATLGFEVRDTLPDYGKYTGSLTFTITTA